MEKNDRWGRSEAQAFATGVFRGCGLLIVLTGCPRMQGERSQPTLVEIYPEHKTLTLVIGQTTKEQVATIIGSPHMSQIGDKGAFWIYNFSTLYGQKNVVLDIVATARDGFTYSYRWDFRSYGMIHGVNLWFSGDVLIEFNLM